MSVSLLQKKGSKELSERGFSPAQALRFKAAKATEFKSILDCEAVRVMSLKESDQVKRSMPDRIIPSRYVLTENKWRNRRNYSTESPLGSSWSQRSRCYFG